MTKKKPKLLILYASCGAGHMQAAKALTKTAHANNMAQAHDLDILDFTPAYFRRMYRGSYIEIVKRVPELWGYLYDRSYKFRKPTITTRLHRLVGNIHVGPLVDYIKEFKPDALVFTHFLGWEAIARIRRKKVLNIPFYCVVTDFAIHSLWMSKRVSKYYVATEGEKRILKRNGFKDNQIDITGIPVSPEFAAEFNKNNIRKELKLDRDNPLVLLISGRYNVEGYKHLLASFKEVKEAMQLVVLAGKDKQLLKDMTAIGKGLKNKKVRVYGMVDNMHDLMAASDIVISKPGGLTTSEVLARKTLMAVIDPIPGQEQRNSDYLLESGVAIRIHDMENGGRKVADLLSSKRRLAIMRNHLKWVSRPYAAYNILKDIC